MSVMSTLVKGLGAGPSGLGTLMESLVRPGICFGDFQFVLGGGSGTIQDPYINGINSIGNSINKRQYPSFNIYMNTLNNVYLILKQHSERSCNTHWAKRVASA